MAFVISLGVCTPTVIVAVATTDFTHVAGRNATSIHVDRPSAPPLDGLRYRAVEGLPGEHDRLVRGLQGSLEPSKRLCSAFDGNSIRLPMQLFDGLWSI